MKKIKIDPTSWFVIAASIVVLSYVLIKKYRLRTYALYAKGVSAGVVKGVHGTHNVDYFFIVNGGDTIRGFVPLTFTYKFKYKCQSAGDTVLVRYESDNPKNNELIAEFPKGTEP